MIVTMTMSRDSFPDGLGHVDPATYLHGSPVREVEHVRGWGTRARSATVGRRLDGPYLVRQGPLCPFAGCCCVAVKSTTAPQEPSQSTGPAGSLHGAGKCVGEGLDVRSSERGPDLTAREKEVLIAWLRTDSKTAVGQILFITAATVRTHIQRIRAKYDAVGRTATTKAALAVRAIQDGLIAVGDL